MDGRKKLSSEVAAMVGTTRKNLLTFLSRNPELRPSERLPNTDFLWSQEEIERLIERRSARKVRSGKK